MRIRLFDVDDSTLYFFEFGFLSPLVFFFNSNYCGFFLTCSITFIIYFLMFGCLKFMGLLLYCNCMGIVCSSTFLFVIVQLIRIRRTLYVNTRYEMASFVVYAFYQPVMKPRINLVNY